MTNRVIVPINERPDIIAAKEWLTANIHTTEDVESLADMLDLVDICFEAGGSTSSAVSAAVNHYYGPSSWTSAIFEALDLLKRRHGRLWSYAGD